MKRFFKSMAIILSCVFICTALAAADTGSEYIAKDPDAEDTAQEWSSLKADYINGLYLTLSVDGAEVSLSSGDIYLTDEGAFLFSEEILTEAFGCAVNVYDETSVKILKGSVLVSADTGSASVEAQSGTIEITSCIEYINGVLYIPEEVLTDCLGFTGGIDTAALTAEYFSANEDLNILPSYYSSADYGRLPSVKNQGSFGACWALAAVSAIEANLLPETDVQLSADHIIYNNGFGTAGESGGDQIMSMSYLLSWKGPVYEEDDPYGDGKTDDTLEAVYHVQEIQYIASGDFEAIKEAVMKYGAVETALYIATIDGIYIDDRHYNYSEAAYCCSESGNAVNHEVIIIGWDDDYPAENFEGDVTEDGAFICLNSWGDGFGDEGVFYVSYEDAYIGTSNVAYTVIESADNYDNIYQYDDVGWTANIGYGKNKAYMANVFTAGADEVLSAVGFYATGEDTSYEVYVITDYEDESSLSITGQVYASGTLENAGYYTITLSEEVELEAGESFAVIVMVDTTGEGKPLACEMDTQTERTSTITTSGKQSYISSGGSSWECTQDEYGANVCVKAYTRLKTDQEE